MRCSRKILVFGYINLNIIDGSAFFVSALSEMLALDPLNEVYVVAANPVKRTTVIHDLLPLENVTVIDPFADSDLPMETYPWRAGQTMTTHQAAELVAHYHDRVDADLVIVRSTEVATSLVHLDPTIAPTLLTYVTGVVDQDSPLDPVLRQSLEFLGSRGATFLLQTPEMMDRFEEIGIHGAERMVELRPMVKAGPLNPLRRASNGEPYGNFVYSGKFAIDWNPREIISGFLEAHRKVPNLHLDILGDQFKNTASDASFIPEIKDLLSQENESYEWHGGVPRAVAREFTKNSDVSISWRSQKLDSSLEFSTKVIEAGSLGRPSIINPTSMHRRIFGHDYPLYADTMTSYVDCLVKCAMNPSLVERAARIAHEVSLNYTYERVLASITPVLENLARSGHTASGAKAMRDDPPIVHGVVRHDFDLMRPAVGEPAPGLRQADLDVAVTRMRELEKVNGDLVSSVEKLEREIVSLTHYKTRYENLKNSRLGDLQTRYWATKKRKG